MTTLITGATGFLGKTICNHLNLLLIPMISLVQSAGNEIRCNLANEIPEIPKVNTVVHAAGKAHSLPKPRRKKKTFLE